MTQPIDHPLCKHQVLPKGLPDGAEPLGTRYQKRDSETLEIEETGRSVMWRLGDRIFEQQVPDEGDPVVLEYIGHPVEKQPFRKIG